LVYNIEQYYFFGLRGFFGAAGGLDAGFLAAGFLTVGRLGFITGALATTGLTESTTGAGSGSEILTTRVGVSTLYGAGSETLTTGVGVSTLYGAAWALIVWASAPGSGRPVNQLKIALSMLFSYMIFSEQI
jgi:hypothetical protein